MSLTVDLNADMGESFGAWQMGDDAALLGIVTSANVACGFHAGDHEVMAKTLRLAKAAGVAVGAHPGFADLQGFGRRPIPGFTADQLASLVAAQIGAMIGIARLVDVELRHVKLHGALSNMAMLDRAMADACLGAAARVLPGAIQFVLPGTALEDAALALRAPIAREIFADRGYAPDGKLLPRSHPDAILHDPAVIVPRILRILDTGTIIAHDGTLIPVKPDTICLHGDEPHAVRNAEHLRHALEQAGVRVAAPERP